MNIPPPTPPAAPPQRSLLGRIVSTAVRLALMCVMLAVGWMLIATYRDLITPPPPQGDYGDLFASSGQFTNDLWQPGGWSFGDFAWTLLRRDVEPDRVEQAFTAAGEANTSARPPVELEQDVLTWLREASKSRPEKYGQVYERVLENARIRAVTTGQGDKERLVLLQVGWGAPAKPWTLVELAPTAKAAPKHDVHLLPLGDSAKSVARRWNESDRLAAELVKPAKNLDYLLNSWQRQGWTVSDRHDVEEGATGFFLTKDDRAIQGWNLPLPGPGEGCILLIDRSLPQPQRRN